MAPKYLTENRYAFVIDGTRDLAQASYEIETPETAFERDVQRRLVEANRLLASGRPAAALDSYRALRGVIASALQPKLPPTTGAKVDWQRLAAAGLTDVMITKSAQMLERTPLFETAIPTSFVSTTALPPAMAAVFADVENAGLVDVDAGVKVPLAEMQQALGNGQFASAAKSAAVAVAQAKDPELRAALLHDQAILQARAGDAAPAMQTMQKAIEGFDGVGKREAQIAAITALAEMQTRGGDANAAKATLAQAEEVKKKFSVFQIVTPSPVGLGNRLSAAEGARLQLTAASPQLFTRPTGTAVTGTVATTPITRIGRIGVVRDVDADAASDAAADVAGATTLMAAQAFALRQPAKKVTVFNEAKKPVTIDVAGGATASLTNFYTSLRDTKDVSLLMGYFSHHAVTVTYLAHITGWVLPMAIGDCLVALGSYEEAEKEYLSTLNYKFLNVAVESVVLWLRLAELYLEWGDRLYRNAANVVADFAPAKAIYERVLKLDLTIDAASPLYASPTFAAMKTRATAAIQTVFKNNQPSDDNPKVLLALARARMQLNKIAAGLNFLGMGLQIPPFSFEYIQNLARYFAQHAAQVESAYIQFKSSGENEALREQQMAQQATLATASVELERRGLNEAREGVDVASAGLNYASVQRQNAVEMKNQFNSVRGELQELERLQAWAGSTGNDEVKLNVTHATYYSADSKPRSHVLFDLANRRAQISGDLEAARLQNEVESAAAYQAMAQQQVEQAQARVAVAQQRVQIANLQAQFAQENLLFLDGREFSSTLWYELAREARRIARRYVDMAIEVAVLMEKAYEAETGRDLRKIKLDYGIDQAGGLLAGDQLLEDIDFFSLDFVRTKSKKAPMKQTLSLADLFPTAFDQLIRTGRTMFETTLDHFDRRYPGFYLQKVKQVELLFVGLAGTEGVHGTLRNIGLSKFRTKDGTIVSQNYPADVMPLTDYNVRQDAIVFQLNANELRLFENNGIATVWQLDLPKHSNTFDLGQILDVQLVIYYDGYFDPGLEATVKAALPAKGNGSRAFGLRLTAPDELFFLRSQGSAQLAIDSSLLPANQADPQLKGYVVQARGTAAPGLKLRVDWNGLGNGHLFTLDGQGNADSASFDAPIGRTLLDTLRFSVNAADNPQLVTNGALDLSGLQDVAFFADYAFAFRV